MATAAPTAMWIPEQINVVSYARQPGGGETAKKKSAVGGAIAGGIAGGIPGAIIGGVAAAVAATAAAPTTHVEYKLVITIQGMQLERDTRWSACETLCRNMAEHELSEVRGLGARLPTKFRTLSDTEDDDRIQKRAAQLAEFFGGVCLLWRRICETSGPASPHARVFNDFFQLPGHAAGQDVMLNHSPFVTQPAVGTDFGDWRVSGGASSGDPVRAGAACAANSVLCSQAC